MRCAVDPLAGGMSGAAASFHGYKYLPVMLALYAPLAVPLGVRGIVLTNLALQGAAAAALGANRRARRRRARGPRRGGDLSEPALPRLSALRARRQRSGAGAGAAAGALGAGAAAVLGGRAGGPVACGEADAGRGGIAVPRARGGRARALFRGRDRGAPADCAVRRSRRRTRSANNIVLFNALRPIDDTSWLYGLPAAAVDRRPRARGGGAHRPLSPGLARARSVRARGRWPRRRFSWSLPSAPTCTTITICGSFRSSP